jgi:hypothetical protein
MKKILMTLLITTIQATAFAVSEVSNDPPQTPFGGVYNIHCHGTTYDTKLPADVWVYSNPIFNVFELKSQVNQQNPVRISFVPTRVAAESTSVSQTDFYGDGEILDFVAETTARSAGIHLFKPFPYRGSDYTSASVEYHDGNNDNRYVLENAVCTVETE